MSGIKCYCTCNTNNYTDKINLHPLFASCGKFDKYWLALYNTITHVIRVLPNNDSTKRMLDEEGYESCNAHTLFENQTIDLFVAIVEQTCIDSTEPIIVQYVRGSKKGQIITVPRNETIPSTCKPVDTLTMIKYLKSKV